MGTAQTGTGKTAAFVLPILHRLSYGQHGCVRSLIITPTRELAEQIHQTIELLGKKTGLSSVTVYGGVGLQRQVKQLKNVDIIVACPGRLLDHINRKTVDLSHTEVLVLDEADQMFDMGFLPDIRRILTHLPQTQRQTLLFSATMPPQIRRLATDVLNESHVRVKIGHEAPADTVSHAFYPVSQHLKTALLLRLLDKDNNDPVLVFTRTKHRAKQLGKKLANAGYRSTSLQGNLSQAKRQEAMQGFKSGKYRILVATDIAARGIDVAKVSHVINYDMPSTAETYIHRIGRTGRADCVGEAFTLITRDDYQMVKAIRAAIGKPVKQCTLSDFNYRIPPKPQTAHPRRRGNSTLSPNHRAGSHRHQRARRPKASVWSGSQRTAAISGQGRPAI
jgi:superfamily II DNA/RNA helicase